MNRLENWFCSTNFWRGVTRDHLLPMMLDGVARDDAESPTHVLELGAGLGAATPELLRRFSHVTSLEYSAAFAAQLACASRNAYVVQGDAAQLPFADESFSCAIAILILHHLRSRELQDRAFAEARRVLRPGGIFLAFEIHDGWLQRLIHTRSTFVPVPASGAHARLNAAGFVRVSVDFLRGGFVLRAQRGAD
jgi:SAM-dependent methyltransferase